ncbi:hypothetical protein L596_017975 [Steinernema carpocapsae]|uniref:Neurotransmitter-gated ion-channel transmembrane domain-containing protein n=1 Tax=Steinernema carpocapsae TaxID=34508 RepID=A0A4V6A1W4_STECR|nr:hypothetical protein L596_017975 [Steinernema carpocapsae]
MKGQKKCSKAVAVDELELPSFRFSGICVNSTVATTASGSYSRLWVMFNFDRDSGFYMVQIFLPAALIVFLSWVSFWINRESAPSRTIIGTLTILTETHLLTGTNRRLPPVSYIKAVDIYLGYCYLNVVLALIEYACVAYSKKKHDDQLKRNKKAERRAHAAQPTPDLLQEPLDARLAECTCDTSWFPLSVRRKPKVCCVRHSQIDMCARFCFPTTFVVFNMIYWLILLTKAGRWNSNSISEIGC